MSTLVTGGRGFVGRQLVDQLLAEGAKVDQLQPRLRGRHPRRADRRPGRAVRYPAADRDAASRTTSNASFTPQARATPVCRSTCRGPPSKPMPRAPSPSTRQPAWPACAGSSTSRQSAHWATPNPPPPSPRTPIPDRPPPYGVTKVAGEMFGAVYNSLYGMEIVSLRDHRGLRSGAVDAESARRHDPRRTARRRISSRGGR